MRILPGRVNIFHEDGQLMKWGTVPMHAEVSTGLNIAVASIFIGDNVRPYTTKRLPPSVTHGTHKHLEDFLFELATELICRHVADILERLNKANDAYLILIDKKRENWRAFLAKEISEQIYTYRFRTNTELLEVAQDIRNNYLAELIPFSPRYINISHRVFFTEG